MQTPQYVNKFGIGANNVEARISFALLHDDRAIENAGTVWSFACSFELLRQLADATAEACKRFADAQQTKTPRTRKGAAKKK